MRKKIFLVAILSVIASLYFVNNSFAEKACTKEYVPVCWVDWITYDNLCMADNVKIKHNWVCKEDRVCPAVYDPVCWVDWITYWNSCDAWNMKIAYKWECKILDDVPRACNAIYEPVCWVDWVTYGNKCAAWDVKIAHSWECKVSNNAHLLDFSIAFPTPIKDEKEFLEKYGKVCLSATDWINTLMISNWQISATTLIWTPEWFKPAYVCKSFEWLNLDNSLKERFEIAIKNLPEKYQKKINSALVRFYTSKNREFLEQVEITQKLVKKIDEYASKIKNKNSVYILDYMKYQVIDLFTYKK